MFRFLETDSDKLKQVGVYICRHLSKYTGPDCEEISIERHLNFVKYVPQFSILNLFRVTLSHRQYYE
jgi:hypothetical protein